MRSTRQIMRQVLKEYRAVTGHRHTYRVSKHSALQPFAHPMPFLGLWNYAAVVIRLPSL